MPHYLEIIRELLFVKKHLSKKINMTYQFEMKDESSSDGEPLLSRILKILRKTMEKDYKIKEMKLVRFFLLSLLEDVCEYVFVR